MATLALTSIGNALGGPIGGAIGGIIGNGIDRSLFGPGPRRGPRLNDLTVQTSSYGTQVPRLYGTSGLPGRSSGRRSFGRAPNRSRAPRASRTS